MSAEQEKKYRIDTMTAAGMISLAIAADILSLVPIAGTVIAVVFGGGGLGLWFYSKGVGFIGPKKVAVWGINLLAEIIPVLGSIWIGYTIGTVLMLIIVRIEDRTGISIPVGTKEGAAILKRGTRKAIRRAQQTPTQRRRVRQRLARRNAYREAQQSKKQPKVADIRERQKAQRSPQPRRAAA